MNIVDLMKLLTGTVLLVGLIVLIIHTIGIIRIQRLSNFVEKRQDWHRKNPPKKKDS